MNDLHGQAALMELLGNALYTSTISVFLSSYRGLCRVLFYSMKAGIAGYSPLGRSFVTGESFFRWRLHTVVPSAAVSRYLRARFPVE